MSNTTFAISGLRPELVQTVADLGYETPSPIQAALIPVMLTGRDVIGQAQTGTGKTAAFSLPLLHHLKPGDGSVQGLVLAPTRELAMQVAKAMHTYGQALGVRVLPIYGGQSYHRQISRLKKGVDIVVGTPGRLLDLIRQGALDLSGVSTVILDEADEMLSMGFIDDLEAILKATPAERQTAVLSATLPQEIRRLAGRYMRDPETITTGHEQRTVSTVEQRYYLVNQSDKLAALTRLFEVEPINSVLIFARTRVATVKLANALIERGHQAEALNGEMNQPVREQVLHRFREGQTKFLVATDVAARGLDIDHISHVVNIDLPRDTEVYVHRVGRTGRAGKTGIALSLVTPSDRSLLRRIEKYTKQSITRTELPNEDAIHEHRNTELKEQMLVWLRRDRCQQEKEMVEELMEAGFDPVTIAAAALKIARAEEKQRPIESIGTVQERPQRRTPRHARKHGSSPRGRDRDHQAHEQDMVRLALGTGRAHGTKVGHIVGSLARYTDLPGRVFGKILIEDQHTLVDVPQQYVGQVLGQNGPYRIGRRAISIERA